MICSFVQNFRHYCIIIRFETMMHISLILFEISTSVLKVQTNQQCIRTWHKLLAIPQTVLSATIGHHHVIHSAGYKTLLHHLPARLIIRNLQHRSCCLRPTHLHMCTLFTTTIVDIITAMYKKCK